MNKPKSFEKFNSTIKLNDSKINELKKNRIALRNKITSYFKANRWEIPKFYSQGSFPLNTNLNPIEEGAYDLDDGLYFICPESSREEPTMYHNRIRTAVEDHASKIEDKSTCVRVFYADGHHIDLPSYWIEKNGNTPQLAHASKGYIESDPKAFNEWVKRKFSESDSNGQLRRMIRYLKAWKDHQENENGSLKLPSGFILTILACRCYSKHDRDDWALKGTVESIDKTLRSDFICHRPTAPTDENLLAVYSRDSILKEFQDFVDNAQKAYDANSEQEASKVWRKVFGDRFPLEQTKIGALPIGVAATKPYFHDMNKYDEI